MRATRIDLLLLLAVVLILIRTNLTAFVPAPITYPNIPFPVAPAVVHPGDSINLTITRCIGWPAPLSYRIDWELYSETVRVPLAPSIVTGAPGCTSSVAMQPIQKGIPPGTYHISRITTVRTFVTTYDIQSDSQPFTVIQ